MVRTSSTSTAALALLIALPLINLLTTISIDRPQAGMISIPTHLNIQPVPHPEIMHKSSAIAQRTAELGVDEKQIIAVVGSYNNLTYFVQNISSIIIQKHDKHPYHNWLLVYCDDYSNDGQYEEIVRFVKERGVEDHCVIIRNNERHDTLYNFYHTIHQCPPNSIIALVDGDDALAHDRVFQRLHQEYQNPDVWLTYGKFFTNRGAVSLLGPVPRHNITTNNYRRSFWTTHLKTFYAWLFQKIGAERLLYEHEFFGFANDQAFMLAMIEMAGKHSSHIPEVLYAYNVCNSVSGLFNRDPGYQTKILDHIHTWPKYKPLQDANAPAEYEPLHEPEIYV